MKEELLKQVESKFTEDSKIIWATKDHLEVMIAQIKTTQAFSKRYQKQNKGQMLSLLNQLIYSLTELYNKDVDVSIIFDSSTPRTLFKKSPSKFLTSLGSLTIAKADIEALTQGTLQKAVVKIGVRNTLNYILNNPLANLVKWECKCNCGGIGVNCSITVASDNQVTVEFTPKQAGKYNFQLVAIGFSITAVQMFSLTVASSYLPSKITSNVPSTVQSRKVATYKTGLCVFIGDRVKRGADWRYFDEDGGAGNLGTVVGFYSGNEYDVTVKWDIREVQQYYRCGSQDIYELEHVQ